MTRRDEAPVVLFVYRRPEHTLRTIGALAENSLARRTTLIVYSDAPRDERSAAAVQEVRRILRQIEGFARVVVRERSHNWGLSRSLTSGVQEVLDEYDQAIVLEDDLEVSGFFLEYMNSALDLYRSDDSVASIHGYRYPGHRALPETFFLRGADCWGWGTWSRAWAHYHSDGGYLLKQLVRRKEVRAFNFDNAFPFSKMLRAQVEGRVDSWAIRWYASAFIDGMFTLYPGRSLVQNIGNDGSGEHSGQGDAYRVPLSTKPIDVERIPIKESMEARQEFSDFLRSQRPPIASRLRRKVMRATGWHTG